MESAQKILFTKPERKRKLRRPTRSCGNGKVNYYMRRRTIKRQEFIHFYKNAYSLSVGCNRHSVFPSSPLPLPSPKACFYPPRVRHFLEPEKLVIKYRPTIIIYGEILC